MTISRIGIIVAAAMCAGGCYLSHELPGADASPDAALDAALDARRDAGTDASIDADASPPAPACRVSCGEPEVVGRLQGETGIEGLLAIAAQDTRVGLLVQQYNYRDGNDFPMYALVSIDAADGTVSMPVPSVDSINLSAAGLHVRNSMFVATMLRGDAVGDGPTTATVAAAAWQLDTGRLAWTEPSLSRLMPTLLPCGCQRLGTGFGLGDQSAAAVVEGDTLWLAPVQLAPAVRGLEAMPLVRWPSAPPRTTPLSGAFLGDGSMALAGGGFAPGLDAREGFLVIARPGEAPTVNSLPGAVFDPPPLLATRGNDVYVFRFVSRTEDTGASGLVAERRDSHATLLDRIEAPTSDGLVPVAMASYRGANGAGLVWVEPSGNVHVLPSMTATAGSPGWRDCAHAIDTPAVAYLPSGVGVSGVTPLLALGSGDGFVDPGRGTDDILIVVSDATRPAMREGQFTILRLPDCGAEAL